MENTESIKLEKRESIDKFNNISNMVEKYFNIAACIPFIGILSGIIRSKAGFIQFFIGFVMWIISIINLLIDNNSKWEKVGYLGKKTILHGSLNLLRGTLETICALTIVGNLLLILPNLRTKFYPRTPYNF